MSAGTPMLKVNGLRTATIADLEHAEAVMGAASSCRADSEAAYSSIWRRRRPRASPIKTGSSPTSSATPPRAITAVP